MSYLSTSGIFISDIGFLGLEQDGLFRRSPNSLLLKQVQDAYDRGSSSSSRVASFLFNFVHFRKRRDDGHHQ